MVAATPASLVNVRRIGSLEGATALRTVGVAVAGHVGLLISISQMRVIRFATPVTRALDHHDRTVSVQDHVLGVTAEQERADRGTMAQPDDDEVSTAALRSSDDRVIRVQCRGRRKMEFKVSVDYLLTDGRNIGRKRSLVDQYSVGGEVHHDERPVPQDRFLPRAMYRRLALRRC